MPRTGIQQYLYQSYRRFYAYLCPGCGFRIAPHQIERYGNTIRARRNRNFGRYISVRQLCMFIEIARSQLDWNSDYVSMDELYRIVEHVSQMGDEEPMDVDNAPLAIQGVLNQLENLELN